MFAVRDGSMWAVGAVGVVGAVWGVWVAGRERCGSAGWGAASAWVREGCGWAAAVGAVGVGAGGAGRRAGAAIEHYFLLFCGEYGSMWAVGAVGVFGAVWVVLQVAGGNRAWGGVGVWGVWVVAGERGE